MSTPKAPAALRLVRANPARDESRVRETFETVRAAAACAPLTEIIPASPGDHAAALGFALAWAVAAAKDGVIFWAAAEQDFFEDGLPNAEGLAQFGVGLGQLLMVRANSQMDALWATEQALTTPETTALCAISPSKKPLNLTATRRLLLTAEKHKTRCILLRLDCAGASAAWSRWNISAAPSEGVGRELGAPAFSAHLARNRAGPCGLNFNLQWDIHSHAFRDRQSGLDAAMDGVVAPAFADGPADAGERDAA
jgi:protein ImuA